jgi:hypothetical protein
MASNSRRSCRFGGIFVFLGADILVFFIIFFDKKCLLPHSSSGQYSFGGQSHMVEDFIGRD